MRYPRHLARRPVEKASVVCESTQVRTIVRPVAGAVRDKGDLATVRGPCEGVVVLLAVCELDWAIVARGADEEDVRRCVAPVALHPRVVALVPLVEDAVRHKHVIRRGTHRDRGLVRAAVRPAGHQREPLAVDRPVRVDRVVPERVRGG